MPPHLVEPLWDWTSAVVQYRGAEVVQTLGVLLRAGGRSAAMGATFDYGTLQTLCVSRADAQLQVIEDVLPRYTNGALRDRLERHLTDGHSAYVINEQQDGLVWRVDPATMAQVRTAVNEAPPIPANWLAEAWNAAYALNPAPRQAYDAAILAVESAYGPVVIPGETHYRLGKITAVIRDGRASNKFAVTLEDSRSSATGIESTVHSSDAVLQMMRAPSYGQRVRHGTDGADVTTNSADEARVAVQLAVTLVQLTASRAFRVT